MEFRYSSMLTVTFIAIIFSPGLPILYLFLVFTFFITYWVDKFTVLRIYRKPPRYGHNLMKISREWLNLAIIFHFIIGFWMYSNAAIFDTSYQDLFGYGTSDYNSQQASDYSWTRVDDRINQYQAFAYVVAFGFFLLCFIFKTIFFNFLYKTCFSCCNKKKIEEKAQLSQGNVNSQGNAEEMEAYSNDYFAHLHEEDLQTMIDKNKIEIDSYRHLIEKHKSYTPEELDDLKWFLKRLESLDKEMHDTLQANKQRRVQEKGSDNTHYVRDPTYDITEITPYCDFLSKEDIMKQDEILGKFSSL